MIHGYTRVSTERQAADDRSSLEDQERRIRAIALLKDEELTMWSDPGVSGTLPLAKRPGGQQMLARLQPGDTVVAAKLDRLFRNVEDALVQSRAWREQNVDLILTDMGTESVTSSLTGRLYFTMLAAFAEFEKGRIAERIQEGRIAKRARGGFAGGRAPMGTRVIGAGREARLEPNPRELEMLDLARQLSPTHGPTAIADHLNQLGYRSRTNRHLVAAQVWKWLNS